MTINWLLIFIPITVVLEYAWPQAHTWIFFAASLAIVPIASLIVHATEHIASRTGDAVGGLLNATFGNAPELIIAVVALNAGATRVYSSMMLIAVISLVVPSAFNRFFSPEATMRQEEFLNLGMVVVLLVAYGLYLLFMLKTHPEFFSGVSTEGEHHDEGERWGLPRAVASLLIASVLAARMSEILVGAAEGTGKALGMSQTFIGIVFLAIVGGAAESGSAIAMARKNKMDLTMGIALGSCIQIALFVAPALVLLSYAVAPHPLELSFGRAELGSLFLAVLIGAMVSGEGRSNWYKGVQLIMVYIIMAFLFYFAPETAPQ